jgi:hypothetical protein
MLPFAAVVDVPAARPRGEWTAQQARNLLTGLDEQAHPHNHHRSHRSLHACLRLPGRTSLHGYACRTVTLGDLRPSIVRKYPAQPIVLAGCCATSTPRP